MNLRDKIRLMRKMVLGHLLHWRKMLLHNLMLLCVLCQQTFEAIDLKAAGCLDYRMKVVAMVAVGVATVDELVVAPAALTDRTVQQGRDEFDLRCQLAERYGFERC